MDANGNVFVSVEGGKNGGYRKFSQAGEAQGGLSGARNYRADDIEVSPDGSIYLLASWKLTRGDGHGASRSTATATSWAGDVSQGGITKYSPSGKRLATAGSITDGYVAKDMAVGPKGDVFVIRQSAGIIRLAEDKSPATANIPGKLTAAGGVVKIAYTLSGVACPVVVGADRDPDRRGDLG